MICTGKNVNDTDVAYTSTTNAMALFFRHEIPNNAIGIRNKLETVQRKSSPLVEIFSLRSKGDSSLQQKFRSMTVAYTTIMGSMIQH